MFQFAAREHDSLAIPQLLKMITIHAAESLGCERDAGSLESGKLADLTIVQLDTSCRPAPSLDWLLDGPQR